MLELNIYSKRIFMLIFVSGHLSLSKSIGAPIIFGPNASTSFESIIAKDGEVFNIGSITIKALHTPGHTMESTTYLLKKF